MSKTFRILIFGLIIYFNAFSQQFETIPAELISGIKLKFGTILLTAKGSLLVTSSMGLAELDDMQWQFTTNYGNITDEKGKRMYLGKNSNIFKDLYESIPGIKLICGGPDDIIYVVSDNNNFGCIYYNLGKGIGFAPFNFPHVNLQKIYLDEEGTLFVATNSDTIYTVTNATKFFKINTENKNILPFKPGLDKDSNFVVTTGARAIGKFSLGKDIRPYSFCNDATEKRLLIIGTNNGLYGYDKQTRQSINYFKPKEKDTLTITDIQTDKSGEIVWFSTLEKGMGRFNTLTNSVQYFSYPKKKIVDNTTYPIINFSRKSPTEFFVAVADSLPAVFNTETGQYKFITDSLFLQTENKTTDIKEDASGNLFITKGGGLYWSKTYLKNSGGLFNIDSSLYGPYITDITLNGEQYTDQKNYYGRYESLKKINLKYSENKIGIVYSCRGIDRDSLVFSWKLDNYSNDWTVVPFSLLSDNMNMAFFGDIKPGSYTFRVRARNGSKPWLKNEVQLVIIIAPPFWQTWWFWLSVITSVALLVFAVVKWRVNAVRKQERLKAKHEKEMFELEAKALRAQMNPHFIFNCMNSIKLLIQQQEEDKAINYLTTFSKLIRTIFQNSNKREITLYDEIETCKLYTQLESMRFADKFSYAFSIDETIDLKLLMVPALIIQPFIENAIWHGIMPKEDGGCVKVIIKRNGEYVLCIIDDDGIGRETSKLNKFKGDSHESKGVHLTQSRIDLDNLINQRNASLEIIDRKDEKGKPAGTTVTLRFKEI